MKPQPMLAALLAIVAMPAAAQQAETGQAAAAPPVEYELSFPNAVHHEARITVTYRDIGDAPLALRMARSSPGRYAIHEFAKNVYSVSAVDGAGRPLAIVRDDPYQWTVTGHDGTVTATYTLYADRGDGTYSQIDATHAHLNMPATLLWARGFDERAAVLHFEPYADDWTVATQLATTDDRLTFSAPDLQYLMDSPAELSDHEVREWRMTNRNDAPVFRLVVHHRGTAEDVDRFAARVREVVAEEIALFGEPADYDFGSYTFLADYLPYVSGDGMEHRNSTVLTGTETLYEADFAQLGTVAHEFFHSWNVERLRPAEIEPFDFETADPTPSLWFAEGFTNYYGPLMVRRARRSSVDDYLEALSSSLSYVVNAPGRRFGSPQEMSLRAPFVDAATAIDPTNAHNIFVSYYPYGAIVALALDLTLRRDFPGVTLDDYMRHLWAAHGEPEIAYMPADLQQALAEVTGDPAFAERFFAASVRGSELPDFAPLLAQAGLLLRPTSPDTAWIGGGGMSFDGGAAVLTDNTSPGTPLYEAGLDRGDEIISIGRFAIDSEENRDRALSRLLPGDSAEIEFIQRGIRRHATIDFAADPALEVVRFEQADRTPTARQLAFREAWLGEAGMREGD